MLLTQNEEEDKMLSLKKNISFVLILAVVFSFSSIANACPRHHQQSRYHGKIKMIHTPQFASMADSHVSNYMDYLTWDGSAWRAKYNPRTHLFTHYPINANGYVHDDSIINYITWDGSQWTATYDPATHLFTHTANGDYSSHTDTILNYKTSDNSNWTVRFED
jgi:hypothetical protein